MLKLKVQTADFIERTQNGQRDKQELYRDLSTYELNFSKRNNREVFTTIDLMRGRIEKFESDLGAVTPADNATFGWLNEQQVEMLADDLQRITVIVEAQLQRKAEARNNFSLVDDRDMISVGAIYEDLTKAMSLLKSKKTVRKKSTNLRS